MTANRTRPTGTSTAEKGTEKKSAGKKSAGKKSAGKKSAGKKAGAEKAPAKKLSTTKSSSTKSSSRKAAVKKTPTTKAKPSVQKSDETGSRSTSRSAPRAESRPRSGGRAVAAEAARQLLELTGKQAEGVTGLERREDGWTIQVEVVEVRRIPDTTDVLALYEVTTDENGDLEGYRRLRRYVRGTPGEDGP